MNGPLLPSGERWSRVAGIARTFAGNEPFVDRLDGSAASESLAQTRPAEGADNLSRISRIVVVMEKNRSFDHTLRDLSLTVPAYRFFAEHFTVCDRWHSTVTGSNWPNRTIFRAGTAAEVEKAGHRWGVYRRDRKRRHALLASTLLVLLSVDHSILLRFGGDASLGARLAMTRNLGQLLTRATPRADLPSAASAIAVAGAARSRRRGSLDLASDPPAAFVSYLHEDRG